MDLWSVAAQRLPFRGSATVGVMHSRFVKRTFSSFFSSHHHRHSRQLSLSHLLLRCSLSTQTPQQEAEMPFIAHYLISSFGVSAGWAMKVSTSKNFSRIRTPEQPDSVVSFLKEIGLSDSQIRSLILFDPNLLTPSVDKILRPRSRALIDAGFTGKIIAQSIQSNPQCLSRRDTLSRLQFWRDFVGGSDEVLLKILRRNRLLISFDINKHVLPRVNLLNEFGLSNRDIANLLVRGLGCIFRSLESLRKILERTEELGFPRGSAMFGYGLQMIGGYSKETIERKMEFFKKTYGWSEEEFVSAFRKFPYILGYSEEKVKSTMDFLIINAKLDPRSIASQPVLLSYSLKKRMVPRHHVLSILQSKGLKKSWGLFSAITYSEERFIKTFLAPYEKDVPELGEAYVAAKDGIVPDLEKVVSRNLQLQM